MMAENEEPKIRRTVTLGSGNKIVYKTDGKSYFQRIIAGRVVSEREIFADQVEERIAQDPPRQATTPVERLNPQQLKNFIAKVEAIKPNAQNRYVYEGKTYTLGGIQELLKPYKDRLKVLEEEARKGVEQEAQRPVVGLDVEIKRVNQAREKLIVKIQDFLDEAVTTPTIAGQNNLRAWAAKYQAKFDQLTKYVDDLSNRRVPVGSVDIAFEDLSFAQATQRPPVGGGVAQENVVYGGVPGAGQGLPSATSGGFTPGEGQSVFGGTTVQPGVMLPDGTTAPVDLSGVNFPETPASTTASTTVTPSGGGMGGGMVTAPAGTVSGPSYTEPATGTTYRPGERIGGEDRALPNGGAVVDGIYIPPGIDYTWLGQQVPSDWENAAKELYGAYYEMIKQYPELGTLIKNRIEQGWSNERFDYELRQTNWWRTTNENSRAWEELKITDPATAQTQLDNRTALIRDTAQRLGITLSGESLAKIAENSIKLGLDLTSQLEDIVGSEARLSAGGVSQLRYGYVGNSIRESARKYGVALSDVTFNEWVDKIAVGQESQETFESYAAQIARNLYPSLNAGFDRGLSFAQMTDPYAQQASRILEIPAAQVDFTDPKWAQAFTIKDEKGNPTQMSYGEWADYLRTNPSFGWEYTDDAKNRAYTVVNRLAELFGAA
jgi:hypothetical protein